MSCGSRLIHRSHYRNGNSHRNENSQCVAARTLTFRETSKVSSRCITRASRVKRGNKYTRLGQSPQRVPLPLMPDLKLGRSGKIGGRRLRGEDLNSRRSLGRTHCTVCQVLALGVVFPAIGKPSRRLCTPWWVYDIVARTHQYFPAIWAMQRKNRTGQGHSQIHVECMRLQASPSSLSPHWAVAPRSRIEAHGMASRNGRGSFYGCQNGSGCIPKRLGVTRGSFYFQPHCWESDGNNRTCRRTFCAELRMSMAKTKN